MIIPAMASAYAGGDGSAQYPYRIENCSQLQNMQDNLSAHYVIMNDMFDCSGWTPIANFSGTLDGRGHQVYNISVSRSTTDSGGDNLGMFSSLNGATIKNLSLQNEYFTGHDIIGGLAARIANSTSISNVTTNAQINGHSYLGGLIGIADPGVSTISKSYATGPITASSHYAGGLVGDLEQGIINDSWSNVAITADPASNGVGGIAGFAYQGSSINRVYALGSISGGTLVGGIIGFSYQAGAIHDSFSTVTMTGGSSVGGLVGWLYGGDSVTDSFYDQTKAGGVTTCDQYYSPAGCTAVNADGSDNNHFYATNSIAPFTTGNWDFANVWQNTGSWPGLRAPTLDTLDDLPAADPVTNVNASPNASTIDLTWTAPSANAGGDTTDYIIQYKVSSDSSWTTFNDGTSNDTSATITGLTPDTDYDIQVAAVNGGGQSNFVGTDTHTGLPSSSIENCQQLQDIKYAPTGDYTLANDIDCSQTTSWNDNGYEGYYGFDPITNFSGSLDGNGHTINGLYINRPGGVNIGLFGSAASSASVSNLHLSGGEVHGDEEVGSLIGNAFDSFSVSNVTSDVTVYGNYYAGGLIGSIQLSSGQQGSISQTQFNGDVHVENINGNLDYAGGMIGGANVYYYASLTISNSSTSGTMYGDFDNSWAIGGFVGELDSADNADITVSNSSSSMTINGNRAEAVGGFIGAMYAQNYGYSSGGGTTTLQNVSATGEVKGTDESGGLVGHAQATDDSQIQINQSHATGNVTSYIWGETGGLVGAIIGDDYAVSLNQVYATGDVTSLNGSDDTGGLVGYSNTSVDFNDVYATGNVSGTSYVGGLLGEGGGDITNAYATGMVTSGGGQNVGGLIGTYYYGELDNSFAVGLVVNDGGDSSSTGGLIGYSNGPEASTLYNDYYAPDTTAQAECIGTGTFGQCSTHSGNDEPNYYYDSTNDPMTAWDFDSVWVAHEDNYPTFMFEDISNSPVIHNCGQLQAIQDNPSGDYSLANDIDCSDTIGWNDGYGFNPIQDFTGSLNGNNHTITGLFIDSHGSGEGDETGIFAILGDGAEVSNLNFNLAHIAGYEDVGTLAGGIEDGSSVDIYRVTATNSTVFGRYNVGGLVGYTDTGGGDSTSVTESSFGGSVNSVDTDEYSDELGGLIGSVDVWGNGEFTLADNTTTANIITGANGYQVGGMVGQFDAYDNPNLSLQNLTSSSVVQGSGGVGGLFGSIEVGQETGLTSNYSLVNSHATGNVTGNYNVGGLLGSLEAYDGNQFSLRGTFASGDVVQWEENGGGDSFGGLVGYMEGDDYGAAIRQSYATGEVNAPSSYGVGGLVGMQDDASMVVNSYATGDVYGSSQIGGLIGVASGIVQNTYASGTVTSDLGPYESRIGGLIGGFYGSGIVANNFSAGQVIAPETEYSAGAVIGYYYNYDGNSTKIVNNYYDRDINWQSNCAVVESDEGGMSANNQSGQCQAVNSEGSDPNHFTANSTSTPLNSWNFTDTWQVTSGLPTLQAYNGHVSPDTVANLQATGNRDNLHLSWDAPANTGGSPIIGYKVESAVHGEEDDWSTLEITTDTQLDVNPNSIDYYSYYDFRVTVITEADISAPSEPIAVNVSDSYEISSCEDLQNINNDLTGNYLLTQDIDCSDTVNWNDDGNGGHRGFEPIGMASGDDFTGTLDGQGHKITGLYINQENGDGSRDAGLIHYADHANIVNFSLVGGSITGNNVAGAIAAYAYATSAFNLSSDLDVTSIEGEYVGGLFGEFWSNSDNRYTSAIQSSFSTGQVTGDYVVGGLAGWAMNATISNSYYNSLVSSSDEYAGGLVGYGDNLDILSSYAAGAVNTDSYYVGGFVGWMGGDSYIANSFAANTVEGLDYIGALFGYNNGNIAFQNDSYDRGISGLMSCLGGSLDTDDCHAVNTMEDQNSAYYMNNTLNAPLSSWDFEGTWRTTDGYPILRGFNFTPSNPTLSAGSATSSRINLSWNHQSGVDHYVVQYKPSSSGDDAWATYNHLDSPNANSVTVNGLTHNTSYDFRVLASNDSGESNWSNVVTKSTTSQVYNISTCDQLQDIQGDLAANYTLENDIDCSATADWNGGSGFWSIGNMDWQNPFTGNLDGNGYAITDLNINRTGENDDSSALFFRTQGSTIKDLRIGGSIDSRYSAGSIVVFAYNTSLENVHSSADVTTETNGEECTGGLVACYVNDSYDSGHIINSSSSGEVNGYWDVGGIVGYAYKLVLSHSYSTSFLAGQSYVGGLAGFLNDSYAFDVYTTGGAYAANDDGYVGGLFGGINSTYIDRSYSSDQIFGTYYVGGLVGVSSNSQIHNSFSESAVSGADGESRGAVVGVDDGGTVLFNTFFDQNRTEQDYCIGNVYPVGGCEAFNSDGNDQTHFFGSTSLAPLDTWDFNGLWVAHDDGLPTLAGVPFLEGDGIRAQTTTTTITVSWDGTDPNGSPITGYELFYRKSGDSAWIPVTIDPALATSATISGLTPSTQYDFIWRPINALGKGTRIQFFTFTKDLAAQPGKAAAVIVVKSKAAPKAAAPAETSDIYLDDFLEYATGLGKQLDLKSGQVVHFTVVRNGVTEQHTATVKEVGSDYVILTIASTPFDVRISLGELKTIAIDGDPVMMVKLSSIDGGLASLQFNKIASEPEITPTAVTPSLLAANRNIKDTLGVLCIVASVYFLIAAITPRKQHKISKH